MPKKLTQEELLERFRAIWGDRYDYSNVNYVNKRTPIIVWCKEHGLFHIMPLSHANGHGCSKCGNKAQAKKLSKPKYDKKELLRRLYEVHGKNVFDFSLIEDDLFVYNGVKTKLPVICKKCGSMHSMLAAQLLKGSGCNTCRLKTFSKANLGNTKTIEERELVAGVGIVDVEYVCGNERVFHIWREMITRCYNADYWKKRPTYEHCYVCDEWKRYSNYLKWYNEHYVEGFEVDKDLLSFAIGYKTYSPNTCCFLPTEINSVLSTKSLKRDMPVGVHIVSGCITASCGQDYLGSFKTLEDARIAYLKEKKKRITELANKWKDKIESRAYDALINLDVENFFNNNYYGKRSNKEASDWLTEIQRNVGEHKDAGVSY